MNIILGGCLGRMGHAVTECAKAKGFSIAAGVDNASSTENTEFKVYKSYDNLDVKGDCIIDFSHFSVLENALNFAVKNNIPILLAATGYSQEDKLKIAESSKKIAVLQTANLSLGIQVLKILAKQATAMLGDAYDIEIIERHHNQKKDAPSGTALLLCDAVKEAREDLEAKFGRYGKDAKRNCDEIGIHAIRGGGVPGEHEIGFYGEYDEVFITHRARDRKVFALGAVSAAEFLSTCIPGLYSMEDVAKHRMNK